MGWITAPGNFPTRYDEVRDLARYPELRFLDRFDVLVPALLAVGLFLLGGWQWLVWGFFISTVVLFHCTCFINSLAHVFGTRPYRSGDDSRNNFLLAILTLGEGWHNNHHYYQASTRQGFHWWQIDITYYVLKTLSFVGIVWDIREPPADVVSGERVLSHVRRLDERKARSEAPRPHSLGAGEAGVPLAARAARRD